MHFKQENSSILTFFPIPQLTRSHKSEAKGRSAFSKVNSQKYNANSTFEVSDATTCRLDQQHEKMYRKEIENLLSWCYNINLVLDVRKMELVIDPRKWGRGEHDPILINGAINGRSTAWISSASVSPATRPGPFTLIWWSRKYIRVFTFLGIRVDLTIPRGFSWTSTGAQYKVSSQNASQPDMATALPWLSEQYVKLAS